MLAIIAPIAILLAGTLLTRHTIAVLAVAVVSAALLSHGFALPNAIRFLGSAAGAIALDVFNLKLLVFIVLVGAFTSLVEATGIARAFELSSRRYLTSTGRTETFAVLTAIPLSIDDYFNSITRSILVRDACDHAGLPRARVSYLVHATALALPTLLPISTAALFVVGLLRSTGTVPEEAELGFYTSLVPLCAFPLFSALTALLAAWPSGPRNRALPAADPEERAHADGKPMLLAVGSLFLVTLVSIPLSGIVYGARNFEEALVLSDVSGALLTGAGAAISVAVALARRRFGQSWAQIANQARAGARSMYPVVIMILLSWLLGKATTHAIEGSTLIAALVGSHGIPEALLPAALFAISAIFTFVMGGAWSAWAILVPLAAPLLATHDGRIMAAGMAAVLSGVVLGESLCPFSDLSILIAQSFGLSVGQHIRAQARLASVAALAALASHLLVTTDPVLALGAGCAVVVSARPWRPCRRSRGSHPGTATPA